jgi:hypothetical protein
VSLALLTRRDPGAAPHVTAGAALPDVPGILLWIVAGLLRGKPDAEVWAIARGPVFEELSAPFHAVPLALAIGAVAWWRKRTRWVAFAASLLLHDLMDLPVHGQDAHRHFWPLTSWRFTSPLSYWDLAHHAALVAVVEASVVGIASVVVWRHFATRRARALLIAADAWLVVLYATGWAFWGTRG